MTTQKLTYNNSDIILIAEEFSEEILTALGFSVRGSGDIKCQCPIHGGDNPSGFSWSHQKKVWRCWTHKCHEKLGGDLLSLIRLCNHCSLEEAQEYVLSIADNPSLDVQALKAKKFVQKNKSRKTKVSYIGDSILRKDAKCPYLLKRGFSSEVLQYYGCFTCCNTGHPLKNRECIPIKQNNKLVGFTARLPYTSDDYNSPKWMIYPKNFAKEKVVFGLDEAANECIKDRSIILVESPLDLFRLYDLGYKNVAALLGTSLSNSQAKEISRLGIENITLFFDNDEAGRIGAEKILSKYDKFFKIRSIISASKPSEISLNEFNSYYRQG